MTTANFSHKDVADINEAEVAEAGQQLVTYLEQCPKGR